MRLPSVTSALVLGWTFLSIPSTRGEDTPKSQPAKPDPIVYVCPACGCASDAKTFDSPGECPSCKMGLVRKEPFHAPRKVALVIFEGVSVLDFTGPAEVFSSTLSANGRAFEVFTVGPTKESIDSRNAILSLTPAYWTENCPKVDVVVMPGGGVESIMGDSKFMEWLKKSSTESEIVMSVSNGATVLAKAGLLDDREATTAWWAAKRLQQEYPKAKIVEGRRVVDDGKIVTASAPAASIDAALRVVERFHGSEAAQNTAKTMDYSRQPEQQNPKP